MIILCRVPAELFQCAVNKTIIVTWIVHRRCSQHPVRSGTAVVAVVVVVDEAPSRRKTAPPAIIMSIISTPATIALRRCDKR